MPRDKHRLGECDMRVHWEANGGGPGRTPTASHFVLVLLEAFEALFTSYIFETISVGDSYVLMFILVGEFKLMTRCVYREGIERSCRRMT